MSEKTEEADEQEGPTAVGAGLVRGIPSRRIKSAGVLDLRGVPAEEVAKIESIEMAGIILVDEANRAALANVDAKLAGTVVTAPSDLRVLVQPDLEVSRAMAEGMSPGQKLMMVGNIFIRPEVPPALLAEKFEYLHLVGILVACEGVLGALFGKVEMTGISIAVPNDVGAVVRSVGQTTISTDYLSRLQDGTTYVNIGQTALASDLPEELLDQKIASYHNVGQTKGPEALLNLLKARCPTNMGQFETTAGAQGEVAPEGPHVGNYGKRNLTRAFLERLEDNSHYENYGETVIAEDVPEDLLARKIGRYENYGRTVGPGHLVAVMEARCLDNYGVFVDSSEEAEEEEDEE